jgi:hypothetical protein
MWHEAQHLLPSIHLPQAAARHAKDKAMLCALKATLFAMQQLQHIICSSNMHLLMSVLLLLLCRRCCVSSLWY